MSVINQMLKDLDKRNAENSDQQVSPSVVIAQPANNNSSVLLVLAGVFITLVIVAFIYLFQENKSLKQQQSETSPPAQHQNNIDTQQLVDAINKLASDENLAGVAPEKNKIDDEKAQLLATKNETKTAKNIESKAIQDKINASPIPVDSHQANAENQLQASTTHAENTTDKPETITQKSEQPVSKSSITIARKQLSSQELAAQKLALADKAMLEKDGDKAEQLLQDVLLLTPDNKGARKQLAAIWYAQRQYQPALNILNQGISIDANEPDFRVMKAKILLQQQFPADAYLTLAPLADLANVDYQALLANAAQQANNLSNAISAYKKLTQLQSTKAKWFLGLAIAYDRNSEFELAVEAYKRAIQLGDISAQSKQFATQRITELGD